MAGDGTRFASPYNIRGSVILQKKMEMYVVTFFLALLSGLSHGAGVLPLDNLKGTEGGSVIFNTTVNQPFALVEWTFINDENIETTIISSTTTTVILTGSGYKGRVHLNTSPISLELSKLMLNDSGEYKVGVSMDGGEKLTGSTKIMVITGFSSPLSGSVSMMVASVLTLVGLLL